MDDVGEPHAPADARAVDGRTVDAASRPGRRFVGLWNPHVVVLVVGGLALVAVGVRLYRSALEVVYSDFTGGDAHGIAEEGSAAADPAAELVRMQVEWTVGPLLIAFGILAVIVGVAVLAVRWRRGAGG